MDAVNQLLIRLDIDRFTVVMAVVLLAFFALGVQFFRWHAAAKRGKNRRVSKYLLDAQRYSAGLTPKERMKNSLIELSSNEKEQLVKLSGSAKNKDQRVDALERELAERLKTIAALEKNFDPQRTVPGATEKTGTNHPAIHQVMTPKPSRANTTNATQTVNAQNIGNATEQTAPPLPVHRSEDDELAEYIATWVEQTSKPSDWISPRPKDSGVEKPTPKPPIAPRPVPLPTNNLEEVSIDSMLTDEEMLGQPQEAELSIDHDAVADLQRALLEKQREIDELRATLAKPRVAQPDSRDDKIRELEHALRGKAELCDNLRQSVDQLVEFRAQAKERAEIIAKLQDQLQMQTDTASNLEQDVDSWQGRYQALEKNINAKNQTIAELKKQVEERQAQAAPMETELRDLKTRWPQIEAEIKQLRDERGRLREIIAQRTVDNETLTTTLTERTKLLEEASAIKERSVNSERERQHKLLKQLDEQKQETADLRSRLIEIDAQMSEGTLTGMVSLEKYNTMETQVRKQADQIGLLQTQLNQKNSTIEALNTQLGAKDSRSKQLQQVLEQKNTELDTLRSEVGNMKTGVSDTQLAEINKQKAELEKTIGEQKTQIEELTDKLNKSAAEFAAAAAKLKTAEEGGDAESNTVTQIIKTLGASVGVKSVAQDWEQGVAEINSQIKGSKKELGDLRGQIDRLRDIEMTANIQDEAILHMKDDLKTRDQRIRELERQLRDWEAQWQSFEETIASDQPAFPGAKPAANKQLSVREIQSQMGKVPDKTTATALRDAAVNTMKKDLEAANSAVRAMESEIQKMEASDRKPKLKKPDNKKRIPKLTQLVRRGRGDPPSER